MRHMFGLCVSGLLAGCLVGCGGEETGRKSVCGTVTLDGEPVGGGTISFAPQDGTQGYSVTGVMDENGYYEVGYDSGPTTGNYAAMVNWKQPTGEKSIDQASGITMDVTAEAIPPKYNMNTELVVEINEGSNEYDFELTTTQ